MVKDLIVFKELEQQTKQLDAEIIKLTEKRDKLYTKMGNLSDRIMKYSFYNTEEIAEIIKDLMHYVEGIPYTIVKFDKKNLDNIVIKPESDGAGPIFKLPAYKVCKLTPTDVLDNSENNIYVYEFINYVYKERSKACIDDIDYGDLSAMLSEYLDKIQSKNGEKKLIK